MPAAGGGECGRVAWATHAQVENAMQITPLHDRILVRRIESGEQTIGGIIIPDSAKEKPQHGEVLAVGKGRVNESGQRIPVAVQRGDRILFGKYAQEITLATETYLILREEEVLAVLPRGGTATRTTPVHKNARARTAATRRRTVKKGKQQTRKQKATKRKATKR